MPSTRCAVRGESAANSPKAPSTWNQAPWRAASSAMSTSGSKSPAFTSPALPITIAGAPSRSASAASIAARSTRPTASRESFRTLARPTPSIPSAFTSLGWVYPLPSTVIGGAAARPSSSTSTPARSAHQRRAHPSATKFAIVAPVVSTPPQVAGRPNSSFSQSIATCSSRPARGRRPTRPGSGRAPIVSQSAPSAAGVVPPSTKWKNLGPAECTAPSIPAISSSNAATAPTPCSGSGPPKPAATSSARGSRTGRSAMPFR